jgi:hypothetical protein
MTNDYDKAVLERFDRRFLSIPHESGLKEFIIQELTRQRDESLATIISNEIDRKKLSIINTFGMSEDGYEKGYNTAINEDIAYLENVLQELTPSAN